MPYESDDGELYGDAVAPDGDLRFAGSRESRRVQDIRNRASAWPQTDHVANGGRQFLPSRVPNNRHTQAIDGLVARLQAYAPSRANFIAPKTIKPEVADEMALYYQPKPEPPGPTANPMEALAQEMLRRRRPEY